MASRGVLSVVCLALLAAAVSAQTCSYCEFLACIALLWASARALGQRFGAYNEPTTSGSKVFVWAPISALFGLASGMLLCNARIILQNTQWGKAAAATRSFDSSSSSSGTGGYVHLHAPNPCPCLCPSCLLSLLPCPPQLARTTPPA